MNKEDLIKQLTKQYEDDFLKINGYPMNRKEKKVLHSKIVRMANRMLKNTTNL